ncbi:PfkB family carbohydrate kinase [Propylenella binzhouense]|uniref:Carbohydrate kinase PfkB domain-containing protein n=1 Tax=Propylenella binzhouense TaxID=2555902 RepID=A0A964T1I1_9HYPH|nr:PfkB family carbohydrate kinase [Propylenella binzhouense]MYZ46718.1 hypothetical protein [Propylenella binzhouense]
MIVSAGESLIDLVEQATSPGRVLYEAVPGGSPWNTALALARLGAPAGYLGPLSTDRFGSLLRDRLEADGAVCLLRQPSERPTALAVAEGRADGDVAYRFHRSGTADRDLDFRALSEALPARPAIYHTGSLAIADDPEGETWVDLALAAADRGALVSLDPNIRAAAIREPGHFRDRLALLLDRTAIVRLSEDDLAFIVEEGDLAAARSLFFDRHGCALLALTCGARGSVLMTRSAEAWVDAHRPASLVDTIGAGDVFTAALLARLHQDGLRCEADFASLSAAALAEAGSFAAAAAGLACGRRGCDPPRLDEVEAALGKGAG